MNALINLTASDGIYRLALLADLFGVPEAALVAEIERRGVVVETLSGHHGFVRTAELRRHFTSTELGGAA